MSTGVGPLWRIDGPLPLAPQYGLLQAARSESVRIVPDQDDRGIERWGNGVELYPYPPDEAHVFDSCGVYGSTPTTKEFGTSMDFPQFDAMTVYLAETCTSYRVWNQDAFRARAVAAMGAVEGAAVEREFMNGDIFAGSPHLADGQGTFPNLDASTSPMNGLALLELEIADSGRRGVIHVSPGLATALAAALLVSDVGGVLRTINGTVVVPGYGYGDSHPAGHATASGSEEWAYATGPIDVRRSETFTIPETVAEALDRNGETPNSITYRVERLYLVTWDTVVQSAVLIDRCSDSCS